MVSIADDGLNASKVSELNQDAIDYLVALDKAPGKYRFGDVCKRNHDFDALGHSIRFKNSGGCILCKLDIRKQYKQGIKTREKGFSIVELTEEAKDYLNSLGVDSSIFRFGSLCSNNHNFNDSGLSIRYSKGARCIICQRECDVKKKLLNGDKILARQRAYYQANKEQCNEASREYRKLNIDKLKDYGRRYREENKETILPKLRETSKKHYLENRDYYKQRNADHYLNNKELYDAKSRKRRAIKQDVKIEDFTAKDIRDLITKFNGRCVYCGVKLSKTDSSKTHLDHVVPLSKGGIHSITNLVPSCSSCNLSKFYYLMPDWYPKQSFYSVLRHRKILVHIGDTEAYKVLMESIE